MSALLAAPMLLSLTLLVSGFSKLAARQGTVDAMTSLRLPLRPLHRLLASVLPVLEIVLALAVWVPLGSLQVVATVLVALLMLAYLVIIGRALTFDEPVECSCFGTLASPTVSRATLWRNVVLTALGALGVLAATSGLMAQAVRDSPLALLAWAGALATAVVLTALARGGADSSAAGRPPSEEQSTLRTPASIDEGVGDGDDSASADDEELLDYERRPIPAAVVQRPGGELVTLRRLTAQQAALLVFVSEGCGPCERVLDQFPGWTRDLSPVMQVKAVFSRPLGQLRERTEQRVGEHGLHDLQFSAREALGASGAPSVLLLGADGLLAGGPVRGGSAVIEFVEEIQQQLRIAEQEGELPARDG